MAAIQDSFLDRQIPQNDRPMVQRNCWANGNSSVEERQNMISDKIAMEKAAEAKGTEKLLLYFDSGYRAGYYNALNGPAVTALVEATSDLLEKLKTVERKLRDISLQMARLHNDDSDENTRERLRCQMLVLASDISYEFDAINGWNLKPAKDRLQATLAEFEKAKGDE